jgi:hypothetical protein
VTFGSPRVGNDEFAQAHAQYINQNVIPSCRQTLHIEYFLFWIWFCSCINQLPTLALYVTLDTHNVTCLISKYLSHLKLFYCTHIYTQGVWLITMTWYPTCLKKRWATSMWTLKFITMNQAPLIKYVTALVRILLAQTHVLLSRAPRSMITSTTSTHHLDPGDVRERESNKSKTRARARDGWWLAMHLDMLSLFEREGVLVVLILFIRG